MALCDEARNEVLVDEPAEESGEPKKWSQEVRWANCREPHKSRIDRLTTEWVSGTISNEQLALQALQMLDRVNVLSQPNPEAVKIDLDDIKSQIWILIDTLIMMTAREKEQLPAQRREVLDILRSDRGQDPVPHK